MKFSDDFQKAGNLYLRIDGALRRADGYINRVMANAVAMMASDCLARVVVENPNRTTEIKAIIASREKPPSFNVRQYLIDRIEDDPILREHRRTVTELEVNASPGWAPHIDSGRKSNSNAPYLR